jgi:hypothetical protein
MLVDAHCLHVVAIQSAAAYMVSINWMKKVNEQSDEQSTAQSGVDLSPSSCIPVFCPSAASAAPSRAVAFSAAVVSFDPLLGHLGLFRLSDGVTGAIDLTVHSRLCDLQINLKVGYNVCAPMRGFLKNSCLLVILYFRLWIL